MYVAQGREKDVAIFSTVRSKQGTTIGFVADEQRINVGLTRARCSLIIVGNAATLQRNLKWRALISHARTEVGAPPSLLYVACTLARCPRSFRPRS